jgi:hypothetical protein
MILYESLCREGKTDLILQNSETGLTFDDFNRYQYTVPTG